MCDALQVESVLNCMVMHQDDDDDSPFWKRKDTSMNKKTTKIVLDFAGGVMWCGEKGFNINCVRPHSCGSALMIAALQDDDKKRKKDPNGSARLSGSVLSDEQGRIIFRDVRRLAS